MSSQPEDILNQKVSLKLYTPSLAIDRILQERVYLKIGRQVKTAQEKMLTQLVIDDQDLKPLTPLSSVDPVIDAKETDPVWFKSKVVSRNHAEIWLKDGQVYYFA
jgi:pSer/pThr/pTyr-binding forkhead associated (FHA) protein